MPRTRKPYDLTRRTLYEGDKAKLARDTGMTRGTIYNRIEHPEKTTLNEFAQIVRAKGLTDREIQLILHDCI